MTESKDKKKKSPVKKSSRAKKTAGSKAVSRPRKKKVQSSKSEEAVEFTKLAIKRPEDSIFWLGQDAKILFVNDTACHTLGYTQKQLLAQKIFDIDKSLTEDNWPGLWDHLKKARSNTIETTHLAITGEEIPVEATASFLEFHENEYVIAYTRPITDRKQAEEALKESESKFRLLSEQGLLAITIIQDGVFKYVNQAMADLTGYSLKYLLSMKFEGFARMIHPEDQPFVMEQARKKQAGDSDVVTQYSFRVVTKIGETKWVDLYSKTVVFQGKNADFVSLVDITDRKKADDVLQKAHDELEFLVKERTVELTEANRLLKRRIFDLYTIFELSRNFNAVLNYETLLDSFVLTSLGQMGVAKAALYLPVRPGGNEFHLARVKGMPPFPKKEVAIKPKSEFGTYITAYNRPVYINEIKKRLPNSQNLAFTTYFEDGLIVPLIFQTKLRGVLVLSGKESGMRFQDEDIEFLSILANQTAVSIENARLYESEREAAQKLQDAQKLLLQSERLAVLGELSAKVAHEVNNPLGIIKNYLQLLEKRADSDDKSADYIQVLKQEIDRIAMIVRQLLDMGRPIHMTFSKIDLVEIINDTISLMERQFDKSNVIVHFNINDEIPEIMAWGDGLKQIIMNLLMNAKYAIDSDGEIFIDLIPSDHTVRLTIEDTGPGIDKQHIPHIFEPFYSTKGEGLGTGLGLSVSNTIVKNHNGTIEFKNTKKGGCFTIELPILQEESDYDWSI